MKRLFFLLFFFFFSPLVEAKRTTEWSLNLDSTLSVAQFPEDYGAETNKELFKMEFSPTYRWKYLESWRFFSKPTLTLNPNNSSDEEKTFFDLSETYVRFQTDTYSLQAGNTLYSWGVTDGYNPLDIINAKQYFDPLHSRKLGALSLTFSQTLDIWDYELVLIPTNREALLPGPESRWLPREIYIPQTPDNDLVLLLPQNLRYRYGTRQSLENALQNNIAFRIQRHGSVLDLALSFFEGAAPFPLIQPTVTGTITQISPKTVISVDPDVLLNTKNYRLRQGGFSLVSSQMDFLLKFATSYSQSLGEDPLLPGWTHENVLGLEKTFNLGSEGILIAVLQHSFITAQRTDDSNLSVVEIFRRGWMLGGKLSWKEVWNFSLLSLYDSIHGSHYEELGISRRFFDRWVVNLTGNFIQGPHDTALGVYEKNDSYSLSLSRSF